MRVLDDGASQITNSGLVLGEINDVWSATTGVQPVDGLTYPLSHAWSINSSGVAAASVTLAGGASPYGSAFSQQGSPAAAYGASGQIKLLPPLVPGPLATAAAFGINDAGVVVGQSGSSADGTHTAVRWVNGQPEDLGAYLDPAAGSSSAGSINNQGQVVLTQANRSYILTGTTLTPITVDVAGAVFALAGVINDQGQVPGTINFADGTATGFVWSNGVANIAPLLEASTQAVESFGRMNDEGVAVGFYLPSPGQESTAILWSGTGSPVDLNTLIDPKSGWHLYDATSINDQGQIVGNGSFNGVDAGFLLTPMSPSSISIPEPATAAFLFLGTALLLRRPKNR